MRRVARAGTRLLSEEALEGGACRTIGCSMSLFFAKEAAWWMVIHLATGKAGQVHFIPIVVVDVACQSSRRGLSGSSDC